jgi:hypothetical protein|tara:strand:+ start:638 stop:823 length:186 start_codon:yes stop_codon:yes gene_type:complete
MIVCFRARGAAFRAALYHQSSSLGDIDETHTQHNNEWMIFILILSADRLSLLLLVVVLGKQ